MHPEQPSITHAKSAFSLSALWKEGREGGEVEEGKGEAEETGGGGGGKWRDGFVFESE